MSATSKLFPIEQFGASAFRKRINEWEQFYAWAIKGLNNHSVRKAAYSGSVHSAKDRVREK